MRRPLLLVYVLVQTECILLAQSSCVKDGRASCRSTTNVTDRNREMFAMKSSPTLDETQHKLNAHLKIGLWQCVTTVNEKGSIWQMRKAVAELALERCLNFTYEYEQYCSYSKVVQALITGKIDLAGVWANTPKRQKLVTFLLPIKWSSVSFLIASPTATLEANLNMFAPFDSTTWLLIFACSLASALALTTNQMAGESVRTLSECCRSLCSTVVLKLSALVLKVAVYEPKTMSARLLVAWWWLFALVVVCVYTAALVGFRAVAVLNYPFTTLDGAAATPLLPLIHRKGAIRDFLKNSHTEPSLRRIYARVVQNDGFYDNITDALELAKTGKYFLIVNRALSRASMADDFSRTGKCMVALAPVRLLPFYNSWAVRKNSPYADALNYGMSLLLQSGLLAKWSADQLPANYDKCFVPFVPQVATTASNLKELNSEFVFLGVGFVMGLVVLLTEKLAPYLHRRIVASREEKSERN